MSKTAVITARLAEEDAVALDALAASMERSRAWIVARAVQRYVKEEAEFRAFVQEGIDDLEAGRFHSQEEVEIMFGVRREARSAA